MATLAGDSSLNGKPRYVGISYHAPGHRCGYADGSTTDIDQILADLDRTGEPIAYYNSSLTDDILGFLSPMRPYALYL